MISFLEGSLATEMGIARKYITKNKKSKLAFNASETTRKIIIIKKRCKKKKKRPYFGMPSTTLA